MNWQRLHRAKISYVLYLVLTVTASVLSFSKTILFAKWLNSADFGLYSLIMTSYVFLIYLGSCGANEYMLKLGSAAAGQGDLQKAIDIRTNALIYGGGLTFAVCLFICIVSLIFNLSSVGGVIIGSSLVATTAVCYNIFDSYYRCTQKYLVFSVMLLAKAVSVLLLSWLLKGQFGVWGIVISEALGFLLVFLVVSIGTLREVRLASVNGIAHEVHLMIRNGLATILVNLVRNVSLVLDRYVVSAGLGLTVLGKYAFTLIIYQAAVLGGGILTNIAGPKWLASFSRARSVNALQSEILKYITGVSGLFLLVYPAFSFVGPWGLQEFFSEYNVPEVIYMSHFIYWASAAYLATSFVDWYFIALSREKVTFMVSCFSLLALGGLVGICYIVKAEIIYYAVSFLISRILALAAMLTGMFYFTKRHA